MLQGVCQTVMEIKDGCSKRRIIITNYIESAQ
jgi:hypothetical protein